MRPFALVLLAGLLLRPLDASATTAHAATVEGLARGSDTVLRGRVLATEARWSGDGKRIFTFVTLEVDRVWAGSAPAQVIVRVPGGEAGGLGQLVQGAPTFAVGEEVVVFLSRDGAARFQVAGLAQGKFRVDQGKARPDMGRMRLLERPMNQGERRVEEMTVDELEARVRSVR